MTITLPGATVDSPSIITTTQSDTSTSSSTEMSARHTNRSTTNGNSNIASITSAREQKSPNSPKHSQLANLTGSRSRSISLVSTAEKKFSSESRTMGRSSSITALALSPREKMFSMSQRQNSLESLYSEGASDVSRIYYVNNDMVSVFLWLRKMMMFMGLRFSSRKGFHRVLAAVVPLVIISLLLLQLFLNFTYGIRYFSNFSFIADTVLGAKALSNYVVGWYTTSITYATVLSVFKRNSHSVRDAASTRKFINTTTWILCILVVAVAVSNFLFAAITNGYVFAAWTGENPLVKQSTLGQFSATENTSWSQLILLSHALSLFSIGICIIVPFIYTVIIHFLDVRFKDILVDVEEKQKYGSQNKGGIATTVSQRGLASSVDPVDPEGFNEFTDQVMVKHKTEVTLLLQTATEYFAFLVKVDGFFMLLNIISAALVLSVSLETGNVSYSLMILVRTVLNMCVSIALILGLRRINRTTETVFQAFVSLAGA
eukprot:TRINITY_DN3816_c0_g1_i3.p1 TRINITY_DN3816_c0_g1~~TRINITY_DN3816_c0_g1_i3.p1  ORF type:complete len:522 (+),score=95.67 TRINITY_DN3816_c0_g1_i3:103-1566(+)